VIRTGDSTASLVGEALVALTRRPEARTGGEAALVRRVPAAALVEMAGYHRVPGVVYRSLVDLGIEDPAFETLRSVYQMAAVAHARCLAELSAVTGLFASLPHPWLVVKGPVLASVAYADPGARLYDDLDLVVSPVDMAAALAAVEESGGRLHPVNWPMVTARHRAELPIELAGGLLGDLHWHLLVTPAIRARFRWDVAESLERRRTVEVDGLAVPTLDPVDGLLYLCLHGSLSGGHHLVWLKDLDQTVEREEPDWDDLVRRARDTRTDLVAAVQLERARTVLGTPVPSPVLAELAGGSGWARWWARRDRAAGPARWGGYAGTGRTAVAATSATTAASAAQLARSLYADVAVPALGKARRREESGGESPELYRPVGGAAERAAYLDMVAGGRWG
jgi:hypothetical protein